MNKSVSRTMKIILPAVIVIGLQGCVASGPPKPTLFIGNPEPGGSATVYFNDSKNVPGQVFKTLWWAGIVEFDGKPVKEYGHAEVKPGTYTIKMECFGMNMSKNLAVTITRKIVVPEPGYKYFPYATTHLLATYGNSAVYSCDPDLSIRKRSSFSEVY